MPNLISKPKFLLLPGLQAGEEPLAPIVGELVEQAYRHPNGYRDSYGARTDLENTVSCIVDRDEVLRFEEYIEAIGKMTDMAVDFAERYHVLMSSLPPSMRGDCTLTFQSMVGPDLLVRIVPPEK